MTRSELRAARDSLRRVRAAAKRRRAMQAWYDSDDPSFESPYADEKHNRIDDLVVLADAYLAEHPADSDLPVTEEWLRAVGAKESPNGNLHIGPAEWFEFGNGPVLLIDHYLGNFELPTRGHVRRLCAALGIALKESTP